MLLVFFLLFLKVVLSAFSFSDSAKDSPSLLFDYVILERSCAFVVSLMVVAYCTFSTPLLYLEFRLKKIKINKKVDFRRFVEACRAYGASSHFPAWSRCCRSADVPRADRDHVG